MLPHNPQEPVHSHDLGVLFARPPMSSVDLSILLWVLSTTTMGIIMGISVDHHFIMGIIGDHDFIMGIIGDHDYAHCNRQGNLLAL